MSGIIIHYYQRKQVRAMYQSYLCEDGTHNLCTGMLGSQEPDVECLCYCHGSTYEKEEC